MKKISTSTSRDRAQQLFNKNIELGEKRQKSLQARIPSDPNTWHQIRENTEGIILEDHSFSEQHNIEFSLWQLHYKRIEEFRAHFAQASARSAASNNSKVSLDRVTKIRVQLKAFLSEATGFYHDLILKIRAKHGLPLGHFSDNSDDLTIVGNDAAKSSDIKHALVSCYRCLIYLGDLVRYKGLYGEGESRGREYSAASSYYLQAASLWPSNGNPHHQLAILANYANNELLAVYRYFRSLAAEVPFQTAKDNLVIAFEKNRQSYSQQLETRKNTGKGEDSIKVKYKDFCNRFVRLQGILYSRTSLETFSDVLSSVKEALQEILSSGLEEKQYFVGDGTEDGLVILRVAVVLIFSVYSVNKKTEGQTYAEILQHNVLYENACTVTFELMDLIVERCRQLHDPTSSLLLPGILVFLEWLACCPGVANCAIDEKKITAAKMLFWKHCVALFNKLLSSRMVPIDDGGDETCFTNMSRYVEGETDTRLALEEDFELRGFLPLLPAQSILDFSRKHSHGVGGSNKERRTRVKRIIAAGKALTSVAMVDQKAVSFDSNMKQFVIGTPPQDTENSLPNSYFAPSESPAVEKDNAKPSENSVMMRENAQLVFDGEDDDEEIVFKPVLVEKEMDAMESTQNFSEDLKKGRGPRVHHVSSQPKMPPISDNIAPPIHPGRNLHNSTWLTEQQASVTDGIKKLRSVDNGLVSTSNVKGNSGFQNAGPPFAQQPSVGLMDTAMYSNYKRAPDVLIPSNIPSNINSTAIPETVAEKFVVKPPTASTAFKSQGGRPVRHLGPPPGFSHVPPKFTNGPAPNVSGVNNFTVDNSSWLGGVQMLSSTGSFGPSFATNQMTLGTTASSNGNNGLPMFGTLSSGVQLQGGILNPNPEYQSFRNMLPNHGQKYPEQHIMPGYQFSSQTEHNQGHPSLTGNYRV